MYSLNETYFKNIDTAEKAYWIGFILTDGYIGIQYNKPYYLEIALKASDKSHLIKFQQAVGHNGRIYTTKNDAAKIKINNPYFVGDLVSLGITNKKSFTAQPIYFQDECLQRAFWRGVIDGDGTIFVLRQKNRNHNLNIGLIGTYAMCCAFKDYVQTHTSTKANCIEKRKGCYRFLISGNRTAKEVHNLLYKDASIYLERKAKIVE